MAPGAARPAGMSGQATPGYRAARETAAFFPDLGRVVVGVRGEGAQRVVNGLVTNDLERLGEGRARYAFMLDPKGRTVAEVRVLPGPGFETAGASGPPGDVERLWLDVPRGGLDALLGHLRKYVPPLYATFGPVDTAVLSLIGPRALEALEALSAAVALGAGRAGGELDELEATTLEAIAGVLVRREEGQEPGYDLYVPAVRAPALAEAAARAVRTVGGESATAADWDILRVERGLPVYGHELGDDRLAQESGQDHRAISFDKGCFTGQEVVARIHYRGHVNRLLRGLRGSGAELPRGGALFAGEKPVGTIQSSVRSPTLGSIALAYVRREIEPGTALALEAGGASDVHVVELPFTIT